MLLQNYSREEGEEEKEGHMAHKTGSGRMLSSDPISMVRLPALRGRRGVEFGQNEHINGCAVQD